MTEPKNTPVAPTTPEISNEQIGEMRKKHPVLFQVYERLRVEPAKIAKYVARAESGEGKSFDKPVFEQAYSHIMKDNDLIAEVSATAARLPAAGYHNLARRWSALLSDSNLSNLGFEEQVLIEKAPKPRLVDEILKWANRAAIGILTGGVAASFIEDSNAGPVFAASGLGVAAITHFSRKLTKAPVDYKTNMALEKLPEVKLIELLHYIQQFLRNSQDVLSLSDDYDPIIEKVFELLMTDLVKGAALHVKTLRAEVEKKKLEAELQIRVGPTARATAEVMKNPLGAPKKG